MTAKEKITTLVEMGFSIDEAMALASGNYRTVPDDTQQPEPVPEPKTPEPEHVPEPKTPEPAEQPAAQPDLKSTLEEFGKTLTESISKAIIAQNIMREQQPAQQSPEEILGLMLEPKAPEMMGGK